MFYVGNLIMQPQRTYDYVAWLSTLSRLQCRISNVPDDRHNHANRRSKYQLLDDTETLPAVAPAG